MGMIILWIIVVLTVGVVGYIVIAGICYAIKKEKYEKEMNTVAKLIQGSNLRSITKISQVSGLSEPITIKAIAGVIENASEEDDYFLHSRINFDKMEIVFEKGDWICPYCALANPRENLVCSGCRASRS